MRISRQQTAVYWEPAGTRDSYGNPEYLEAVEITCRWENRQEVYRDKDGREVRSLAVVYPDRALEVEGMLVLADLDSLASSQETDPSTVVNVQEIKSTQESRGVRKDSYVYKVWL